MFFKIFIEWKCCSSLENIRINFLLHSSESSLSSLFTQLYFCQFCLLSPQRPLSQYSASLEALNAGVDGAWAAWAGGWHCPWQKDETRWALRSLPTQNILWFYDSVIPYECSQHFQGTGVFKYLLCLLLSHSYALFPPASSHKELKCHCAMTEWQRYRWFPCSCLIN